MLEKIIFCLRCLKSLFVFKNLFWAMVITKQQLSRKMFRISRDRLSLHSDKFGIDLTKKDLFLIEGYHFADMISERAGGKFERNKEDICIKIGDIRFIVQNENDLFTLNEIFLNDIYNFKSNDQVVVWDVGMNVGMASLYFGNREDIVAVYGYEPFRATYEQAIRNFGLNEKISKKIHAFNSGISDMNHSLECDYYSEFKGSMGVNGLTHAWQANEVDKRLKQCEKAKISLLRASEVLDSICENHKDNKIVLKMDCEGSEYSIISQLWSHNKLDRLSAIIVEWHHRGPVPIEEALIKSGFQLFSLSHRRGNTGMIYANICNQFVMHG